MKKASGIFMMNFPGRSMRGALVYMVFATFLFSITQSSQALTNTEQPMGTTTPAKRRILVVETVHSYDVREYAPALRVDPKSDLIVKFPRGSPEGLLFGYFAAMRAGDYEAFFSSWTSESQSLMREQDTKRGFSPTFWREQWRQTFASREIFLTHWINYGKYVLVRFRVGNALPDKSNENMIVLAPTGDGWKLTQELRADQFVSGWDSPTGRIQVPAEAVLSNRARP